MNNQQYALVDSLREKNAEEFATRIVRYVAPDLTERYFEGRWYQQAHEEVETFAQKCIDEGEASMVLTLPDGGISRLTLWVRNNQLQMELVKPHSSQFAHQKWESLGYSSDWLPIQSQQQKKKHWWWPF